MAPIKPDHQCHKEEIIEAIRENLGNGAIAFTKVESRLENIETVLIQIREQTTKTNGRVSKLERFVFASRIIAITTILLLLAAKIGLVDLIIKFL